MTVFVGLLLMVLWVIWGYWLATVLATEMAWVALAMGGISLAGVTSAWVVMQQEKTS